jgi:ACS family allantoate permease-like MFS transporter
MVLRTLQGIFESAISPGFLLITGAWYTTQEHPQRALIWNTANAGFGIVASLSEYGIGKHVQDHPGSLAAWRAISLFLGSLTICVAIGGFFVLGTPQEVRWLTPEQKKMAAARIVGNQTGTDAHRRGSLDHAQIKDTFKDPQTYFFVFASLVSSMPNGGLTSCGYPVSTRRAHRMTADFHTVGNLVYTSFGFSPLDTLIKGSVPRDAFSVIYFVVIGYITLKRKGLRCMLSTLAAFSIDTLYHDTQGES